MNMFGKIGGIAKFPIKLLIGIGVVILLIFVAMKVISGSLFSVVKTGFKTRLAQIKLGRGTTRSSAGVVIR
jgi:hypothetical protein